MSDTRVTKTSDAFREAAAQLREAADANKCWQCGCLHGSLKAITSGVPPSERGSALSEALDAASARLTNIKYDCLGCEVCYPALAMNALEIGADACAQAPVKPRDGWPPLPGSYEVLRYMAPVAVCTLADEVLVRALAQAAGAEIALVGPCQTENLGIERLIENTLNNPNIRFLLLCGADSRQAIGHLPGQALLSLAADGIDEHSRIIGARGKRPLLKNISAGMVEHFRRTVEVVDHIGFTAPDQVLEVARRLETRTPGPAEAFAGRRAVSILRGTLPQRMTSDPAGYFVVYPDRVRGLLSLEHYANTGVLDVVIEGRTASEVYSVAVERELLSRLDHACYLGKELARAERALTTDEPYVQDAAPERPQENCGCSGSCGESG